MFDELLPDTVVAVETRGGGEADHAPLYPEERALVERAVDKRRREFTAVRSCARQAMRKLGVPPRPVLTGERGAPRWPQGLVGSMSHCDDYRAAALAFATDLASLGIDCEPHAPLPDGTLPLVSLPGERERLARLTTRRPEVHWDRLLFSAKESVYKAWFPLTHTWLDFEEADIEIHAGPEPVPHGTFRAHLLVPGPLVGGRRREHFDGQWSVRQDVAATAVSVLPH